MIGRIELSGDAEEALKEMTRAIRNTKNQAITATMRSAREDLKAKMPIKADVKATIFKRFRIKTKRFRDSGVVWMGLNEVKSGYVGKLEQIESGAFAGKYFFKGGFVAEMASGHKGVFTRIGNQRLPIQEETVNLNIGFEVSQDVARQAERELKQRVVDGLLSIKGIG